MLLLGCGVVLHFLQPQLGGAEDGGQVRICSRASRVAHALGLVGVVGAREWTTGLSLLAHSHRCHPVTQVHLKTTWSSRAGSMTKGIKEEEEEAAMRSSDSKKKKFGG